MRRAYNKQHREEQNTYNHEWRRNHPDRAAAHLAVSDAMKNPRNRKGVCAECWSTERVEAHHPDYGQPLKVVWLCRRCHVRVHAGRITTVFLAVELEP